MEPTTSLSSHWWQDKRKSIACGTTDLGSTSPTIVTFPSLIEDFLNFILVKRYISISIREEVHIPLQTDHATTCGDQVEYLLSRTPAQRQPQHLSLEAPQEELCWEET